MGYLPDDYEVPEPVSAYLKFSEGSTTFRALTSPIIGWEYWIEKGGKRTPIRVKDVEEVPDNVRNASDNKNRQKHFWMLVVLDRDSGEVKVLEITQIGIIRDLSSFIRNEKLGDLRDYDIMINKVGKDRNTKYSVSSLGKEKLSKEVQRMVDDKLAAIDLEKVFYGESPFLTKE